MTDRVETVRRLYSVFANGDGASLQQLLADTHWVEAPGMPYGGTYRGFGEVAANVFGPIGQDVQNFSAVPEEIMPAGEDRVLAVGTYRGIGSGGELAARLRTCGRYATARSPISYNMLIRTSSGAQSAPDPCRPVL